VSLPKKKAKPLNDREAKLRRLEELERKQVEDLQWMADYRQKNLIEFFDKPPAPGPNPKQAQILEAFLDLQYKTLGMSMGERAGKTTLLTILGISVLIGKYLWSEQSLLHLFPHKKPRKVRYIGQGWHDHIQAVVIPEIQKWWPASRPVKTHGNGVITDTFWKDEKTGGSIEIMSNTQAPEVHRGWSGDLVLYDEPCKRDIYTSNARGLVDRRGKEVFACTLLNEPWIDREIVRRVKDGRPDRSVFWVTGSSYENVGYGITKEGLEEYADKLKEHERKARIDGIPEYRQGLVYPTFSRKIHLVKRFQVPLDWMVDVAIDVHPREKQAILFIATDPRQDRYVCEEIWDNGDGKWVGEQVVKAIKFHSYRVNHIIIDPLAKGDSNNKDSVFDQVAKVLMAHGHVLEVATKDKHQGILEVKNHLVGPNGKPSIFFFDDLVRTIYEIEGYMWDKETQKPVDADDHFMEDLYRTLLLNTKWVEQEDEEEEGWTDYHSGRDQQTGY
jgi:hypothetical protein